MNSFPLATLPSTNIKSFLHDPAEKEWKEPFSFICGADTQFGMLDHFDIELLKQNEANPDVAVKNRNPSSEKEIKLTRESILRINAMNPKPRFYVICGDMVDAFPNEGELRARQYSEFCSVFKELDPAVKLICVCGNHDIGNHPTEESLTVYRNQFGPDVFSFWVGGVKFVVLNSQYFHAPDALPVESQKQLEFLSESVADSSAKHIVVFQHIPFFLRNPEEEKEYFNLEKDLRLSVLETLYQSGIGVRYVFCGHYHRNAGGFYKDLEQVVTGAVGAPLGKDPSGFRTVCVAEDKLTHEYIPFRQTSDVACI